MLTYRTKVIIATLSLVIMSSAFIQTSYSQQPTSNSSLSASGTLKMGLGLGENVSSDVGFANNNQTASSLSTTLLQ